MAFLPPSPSPEKEGFRCRVHCTSSRFCYQDLADSQTSRCPGCCHPETQSRCILTPSCKALLTRQSSQDRSVPGERCRTQRFRESHPLTKQQDLRTLRAPAGPTSPSSCDSGSLPGSRGHMKPLALVCAFINWVPDSDSFGAYCSFSSGLFVCVCVFSFSFSFFVFFLRALFCTWSWVPCLRLCEVDDHADGALDAADGAVLMLLMIKLLVLMTLWMMLLVIMATSPSLRSTATSATASSTPAA